MAEAGQAVRARQTLCVKISAITYLVSSLVIFKTYDGGIDLIRAILSLSIVGPFTWAVS
jgi:hypothetical protein